MDMNSISNFFNTYYPSSPTHNTEHSSPNHFSSFMEQQESYPDPYDYSSSHHSAYNYAENDHHLSHYTEGSTSNWETNNSSAFGGDDGGLFGSRAPRVTFDHSDFSIGKDIKKLMLKESGMTGASVDQEIKSAFSMRKYMQESAVLSTDEYAAISLYGAGLYKPMNNMLWKKPSKVSNPVVQSMNSGLRKLAQNPDNIKTEVHRGIRSGYDDKRVKKEFKLGKLYSSPAFSSTSTSRSVAGQFTDSVQLHIRTQSAVSIEKVTGSHEKEAIIPPNTPFRVTDLAKKEGIWHVDLDDA